MHTPGRDGSQPGVTAGAAPVSGTSPRWQVVVVSFAAIIAVWLLSIAINATFRPAALVIPAGIGLFAMLFAVTQGLERLLSLFRHSSLARSSARRTATDFWRQQ
jgi:hypothetical protein